MDNNDNTNPEGQLRKTIRCSTSGRKLKAAKLRVLLDNDMPS